MKKFLVIGGVVAAFATGVAQAGILVVMMVLAYISAIPAIM